MHRSRLLPHVLRGLQADRRVLEQIIAQERPEAICCTIFSMNSRRYSTRRRWMPSALGGVQLLLDFLDLRMAHVLAAHEVDQVFADVLGMISDALE